MIFFKKNSFPNLVRRFWYIKNISSSGPALFELLAIISYAAFKRSFEEQEHLKPHWELEKRSQFSIKEIVFSYRPFLNNNVNDISDNGNSSNNNNDNISNFIKISNLISVPDDNKDDGTIFKLIISIIILFVKELKTLKKVISYNNHKNKNKTTYVNKLHIISDSCKEGKVILFPNSIASDIKNN